MKYNHWKIHLNKKETQKVFENLKFALEEKNFKKVLEIIANPINIRSFIVRRGEKSMYMQLALEAFFFILNNKFKEKSISKIKAVELVNYIHKINLPERILPEVLAIAFHKNDRDLFYSLYNLISDKKVNYQDPEIYVYTLNIYGAWQGSKENQHEKNLEINKQVLALAREKHLEVMECKALFALSDHKAYRENKSLKPKNQIEDYKKLAKRFNSLGVDHDALRCDIELAQSYLNLAKRQTGEDRNKNLKKALLEAKKSQERAKKIKYPNALIYVKIILSDIYKETKNDLQSNRYKNESEKLKLKYF